MQLTTLTDEPARLRDLHRYELLDTSPEPAFDRLTTLTARLFHVPVALVSLVDKERQWFKSVCGLDICQTARDISFCAHAIAHDEVFVVPDASRDPRFADNPLVTDRPGIRFYAGAPLVTPQGHRIGTLCVIDFKARATPTEREIATLRDLAALTMSEIELRHNRQHLETKVAERTAALHAANLALTSEAAERRRVEAALAESHFLSQAVFEGATDAVYVKDLRGRYLMMNPAGAHSLGRVAEEIVGKDDLALFEAESARQILQRDQKVISGGQPCTYETISRRSDGVAQCYLSTKSPLRDHKGAIIGLIGISHDITELHAVQQDLRAAKEEAERANNAKSEFLASMSHELRTPLNAVLGFSQLMQLDDSLSTAHQCALEQIHKAGRHLLGLIDEVLDISRIEAGGLRLNIRPVEIGSMLRECVALVAPLAGARGITWENGCLDDEHWVMADAQRVRQVLINLLTNAVKYNRPAGRVLLDCAPHQAGPGRLCVRVSDTGLGMSPQQMARLFVPFERLGAEHGSVEGTGLGLALSKRLVEAMGGELRVESAVGLGSAFTVELPGMGGDGPFVGQAGELTRGTDPSPEADLLAPALCAEPVQARQPTVLYVEDNASNLALMRRIFAMRPALRLISAGSGLAGLEEAQAHRPALILLDVQLPDLSGDQVLEQLRGDARTAGIPVVVISAGAMPEQITRLLDAGARSYVTKPIDVTGLLNMLDEEFAEAGAMRN